MFQLEGTDTTVNGVPATNWGGHVDVYYEETTVAIFGDAAPKREVAEELVPAPAVPATLARYGLFFDSGCIDRVGYCEADRSLTSEGTEFLISILWFYGPLFGVPFLAGLLIGRVWVLVVPVIIWSGYYVAGSMGWVATGESWGVFVIPGMLLGVAAAGFGLILRWLLITDVRSRRAARA